MVNKRIAAQIPILFGIFSWLHMMVTGWPFFSALKTDMGLNWPSLFNVLAWMSYSFIYVLPSLLLIWATGRLFPQAKKVIAAVAIISTSSTMLFIRADSVIYDLYNFHFNGFVINLIMTPGGVESLGGGTDTYISIALTTIGHIAAQVFGWFLSVALATTGLLIVKPLSVLLVLLGVSVTERVMYGVSDIKNNGAILEQAKAYPFYAKTKFRTFAGWLGIKPAERTSALMAEVSGKGINYPLAPVEFAPVKNPPNIVVLVAESLRWDRLNPEIMPNTWQFAQKSQHFLNHYSSGNGTREGLFGLFYGLYGSYWSQFLGVQKSPLLMDRLQALNYQFDLRTSARFSYPEFNKTLFAKIPLDVQHEAVNTTKEPWERDEENAAELINFLKGRDKNKPFMSFMFFESTHARYDFPESAIIAKPYLESVNYASMSRESLRPQIGQLLNRYTNAAHWVDRQMGRIYAALEQEGLLENTIVIVTGDHGEEFMEKGFWGHNSSFVQEQVRTPMVISMPGRGHQSINYLTSHLDVSTTLLQQLGAPQDSSSYSLGRNIFDSANTSRYVVSSDWHSIGIIHPSIKYRVSYNNRGMDNWEPTRLDDAAVSDAEAKQMLSEYRSQIMDAIQNTSKFIARDKK